MYRFTEINLKKEIDAISRKKQEKSWAPFSPLILKMFKLRRGIRLQFFSVIGGNSSNIPYNLDINVDMWRYRPIPHAINVNTPFLLPNIACEWNVMWQWDSNFCHQISSPTLYSSTQVRLLTNSTLLQSILPLFAHYLLFLGPWSHAC